MLSMRFQGWETTLDALRIDSRRLMEGFVRDVDILFSRNQGTKTTNAGVKLFIRHGLSQ